MLNCLTCGYESPNNARFCRQCGAPLPVEDDQLEATRRMQGRQNPAVVTTGSTPLPPSIGDAVAGATLRYQPPLAQSAYTPPGLVPPVANTSALKSKRRYLKWGALLLALLISGGIGAAINEESNSPRIELSPEDRAGLELLRTQRRLGQTMTGSVVEQSEETRKDLEQRLEAFERAKDEAENASERGAVVANGEKPLDLTAYEYQGAAAGQFSRIPGKELLTQRTKDDFETVVRFYREQLGPPLLQTNERNQRQALFQSTGATPVTVLVREGRDRGRQLEIIVLRSPFRFPSAQLEPPPPAAENSQSKPEPKPKTAPPPR